MAREKAEYGTTWKKLMNNVDLVDPTTSLDHVYLGCTQRECKPSEDIVEQYKEMFESRISDGATEKLPGWVKPFAKITTRSYDMEGHTENTFKDIVKLTNTKTEQLYKVSSPCLDDHHLQKEELESVGELSEVCSQNELKCLYRARIGRPDILWSTNKLARSVTKWTQVCDRRLARLISYIHHRGNYRLYCHVGNAAQHCRLGLFKDSDFAGDFEDLQSTSGEFHVYLEVVHLFLLVGCAISKHQYLKVPQDRKSFHLMLDCESMIHLLSICGIW